MMIPTKFQDYIRSARYVWITTVRSDGLPQPTPVFFLWNEEDNTFIVLSRPDAQKVKNVRQNPKVALNWANENGGQFFVIMGTAQFVQLSEAEAQAYLAKYPRTNPEGMSVIRIVPEQVRGM